MCSGRRRRSLVIARYSESNLVSQSCVYCGAIHDTLCSRIKAIEYHPNGTIKRVELFGTDKK